MTASILQTQASQFLTPQSVPAIQRSQYLADALSNLQANTNAGIKTPTALWTNLLANGLLQYSKHKSDQDLAGVIQSGQQQQNSLADGLMGVAPGAGAPAAPAPAVSSNMLDRTGNMLAHFLRHDSAPPAPGAAPTPGAPPEAASPPPGPTQAAPPSMPVQSAPLPPVQPAAQPDNTDALWSAVRTQESNNHPGVIGPPTPYGRAQGLSQMLPATARSMADKLGVAWRPELMTGTTPEAAAYQDQLGRAYLAEGLKAGNGDPRQAAMFYFGGPDHKLWGPKTHAYADQVLGRMGGASPAQTGPADFQPFQVASNGPTPFPSQQPPPGGPVPAVGAPPPSAAPSPAMGGGAAPGGSVPTGVGATPQEIALYRQYMSNPQTRALGMELAQKVAARHAQPVDPSKPYWGSDGQAHYAPGTTFTDVPGPENAFTQRGPDNQIHVTANPSYGALPTGGHLANGAVSQLPTQQMQTYRIPGTNGLFVNGPDGRPTKVGDDQYGPEQLISMRDKLVSSEPIKLYQQAQDAYGAMQAAAKLNPGGMRAYALRDTFARAINPGAVARSGTIEAIKESQGLPANVKAFFLNMQGDGNVPPEIAQQILDVTQGFVASHYQGAKALNDSNTEFAKRHGVDPEDITVPLGDAPQRFVIPQPKGATPAPQYSREQLLQEARRRGLVK